LFLSGLLCIAMLLAPASSGAAVSCNYSAGDHLLTVTTSKGFGQVTRSGDSIVIGDLLKPPIGCAGGTPTVTNTDHIFLRHTTELDSTDLYLSGGAFAPGATVEPDGSSEIEFDFADDGEVEVHGTSGPDVLAWGPADGLNLNFDVNGDRDVEVTPSPYKDGFIVANGGGGNDQILSQPDYTGLGVFSSGGPGNDTLVAPRQGGILEGGPGRDTIVGGGFDLISGGRGKDLIRAGNGADEIGTVDGTKDRVSCGNGRDSVKADRVDKLHGCEHVRRAGKGRAAARATVAAATRPEYIAQADPICQRTIQAEGKAIGGPGGVTRLIEKGEFKLAAKRLRKEIAVFAPGVEQIAALEPPPPDTQLIGTWVATLRAEVPIALRLARLIAHGHSHGKLFKRDAALNARARALVADYGFQVCWDF
jgi:RTX calcium-binding nonapeptide repeat (4 copies)